MRAPSGGSLLSLLVLVVGMHFLSRGKSAKNCQYFWKFKAAVGSVLLDPRIRPTFLIQTDPFKYKPFVTLPITRHEMVSQCKIVFCFILEREILGPFKITCTCPFKGLLMWVQYLNKCICNLHAHILR